MLKIKPAVNYLWGIYNNETSLLRTEVPEVHVAVD